LCPSCFETIETDSHIFSCECRSQWRINFTNSPQASGETTHTTRSQDDPSNRIQGTLLDQNFQLDPTNREARFELLANSQNEISWSHLLRGRLSHHWVQIQQVHINSDDDISSKKFIGEQWLRKVLNHLWTQLYSCWKQHNADLHGLDKADKERKRKAKLKPDITALYKTADDLDYLDKCLFSVPLKTRLRQRSSKETACIYVVSPTVRQAKAEEADHIQKTQRDIREFIIICPIQMVPRSHAVQINKQRHIPRLDLISAYKSSKLERPHCHVC
jgi:hypothetical protein